MTILILEDQEMVAELWRRNLEAYSDDIRLAVNIPELMDQMRRLPPPDLVLMDLRVPGSGDPRQTLLQIRLLKEINPSAFVLVITAADDDDLPALAMQLGADGFHHKRSMVSQTALLCAIRNVVFSKPAGKGEPAYVRTMETFRKLNDLMAPASSCSSS